MKSLMLILSLCLALYGCDIALFVAADRMGGTYLYAETDLDKATQITRQSLEDGGFAIEEERHEGQESEFKIRGKGLTKITLKQRKGEVEIIVDNLKFLGKSEKNKIAELFRQRFENMGIPIRDYVHEEETGERPVHGY